MTDLRDHMHDTVDHQHTDLAALTGHARRQGTKLRRRHRLAVAGGALAVCAVLGAGAVAGSGLLPRASVAPQDVPVADHGVKPRPAHRAPAERATGRSTVAALYAAVTEVVPGTGSKFAGQSPSEHSADTYGELAFSPADGSGAGLVGVNIQDKSIIADQIAGQIAGERLVCLGWMEACRTSTLPDGSLLRTYAEHSAAVNGGTGERLVAERVVGQVRVVASATNGFELPANEWDITRSDAVLSTEQLTTVVSRPWWGFELPGEFSGELDVPSYTEYASSLYLPEK
jgi:hypothetical protein